MRCAISRLVCSPTRIPSRTIGHSCVFTPSSSKPTVPTPPGIVRSAVTLNSFEPYFSLPRSDDLDEARAGVVRFVAEDAIELGGVRDDLVDREHRVRRRQHQVLDAHLHRLGGAELDRLGGDALGVLDHLRALGNLPAPGHHLAGVGRDFVSLPSLRAVTLNDGEQDHTSCSM